MPRPQLTLALAVPAPVVGPICQCQRMTPWASDLAAPSPDSVLRRPLGNVTDSTHVAIGADARATRVTSRPGATGDVTDVIVTDAAPGDAELVEVAFVVVVRPTPGHVPRNSW